MYGSSASRIIPTSSGGDGEFYSRRDRDAAGGARWGWMPHPDPPCGSTLPTKGEGRRAAQLPLDLFRGSRLAFNGPDSMSGCFLACGGISRRWARVSRSLPGRWRDRLAPGIGAGRGRGQGGCCARSIAEAGAVFYQGVSIGKRGVQISLEFRRLERSKASSVAPLHLRGGASPGRHLGPNLSGSLAGSDGPLAGLNAKLLTAPARCSHCD